MIVGALFLALSIQAPPASISGDLKAGEEHLRLGEAAPAGSPERRRLFENAADDYRKGMADASSENARVGALEMLALLYDARHLNEPAQAELVLRELTAFAPDDLSLLFRLSRAQEDQQELDAAEATLLYARHHQPTEIEPNRMLTQFYARRVAEVLATAPQPDAGPASMAPVTPAAPVSPDQDGFYRAGESLPAPRRLDVPRFPREAQDSGIAGVVLIEVSLNEAGVMTGARVLRSVPILDEAALDAVRNWHYEPTMMDGRAVPAKLTVTVNFSLAR
jgi:TonB family protein